jgi:hypothetical protein
MLKFNVTKKEAMDDALAALEEAGDTGHFMVAVWTQTREGGVQVRRVTYDYPRNKLQESVELLERNVKGEISVDGELPDEPLPRSPLVSEASPKAMDAGITVGIMTGCIQRPAESMIAGEPVEESVPGGDVDPDDVPGGES